jgi:hypothetical protein
MKESIFRKEDGRYFCENTHCLKWTQGGCLLRKVGLSCDNGECKYNVSPIPGVYQCGCMDVHLDSNGRCLGYEAKNI